MKILWIIPIVFCYWLILNPIVNGVAGENQWLAFKIESAFAGLK